MRFLEDEMSRFNYTTHSVPLLCTSDVSWPIIKTFVGVFNNESVEEYIGRSYTILSGKATNNDLPVDKIKTFTHISLCHIMKAFTKKVNKCFKEDRNFIKFSLSLFANVLTYSDIFDISKHFFTILLCKFTKSGLRYRIFEKFKCDTFDNSEKTNNVCETNVPYTDDELPVKEDIYLQQSKRSIFYKDSQSIFSSVIQGNGRDPENDDLNKFFSPSFAKYFLEKWCVLIPFWISVHLGDRLWSEKFAKRSCVIDPPRTQGIIEFHNKSVKHITLNSKRNRLAGVAGNLLVAKIPKHRQFEIVQSRKKSPSKNKEKATDNLPKTISKDNWFKRGKKKLSAGPGFFQRNYVKKNSSEIIEPWQRVGIIPWDGEIHLPTGKVIQIVNSCTVDPFLQIIYMFYALHIHEMRKLFESDHPIVKQIREVVQLLLTDAFNDDAKHYWLTEICTFSPDSNNIINSLGKIFQRQYKYTCSSDMCPSKTTDVDFPSDIICDMTLHKPNDGVGMSVERSIMEWELGTSAHALVSCKEKFSEEPNHSLYISEKDHGVSIVRCSGWRNVSNISFVDNPPFFSILQTRIEKSFFR